MSNGNAPTLQSVYSCEENCRRTYTDWIAVSPETTETGVADLFYTVLFNGVDSDHPAPVSLQSTLWHCFGPLMSLISNAATDRNEHGRLAKSGKQAYDDRNEKVKLMEM